MKIPDEIRHDIPLTKKIIYFDSAATSLTPRPVVKAMDDYYMNSRANVHRGLHRLSLEASRLYEEARLGCAQFINAREEEVFFLGNATDALNLVSMGITRKGDTVVTTELEHHSNFLPWLRLKEKGCRTRIVRIKKDGRLDMEDLKKKIEGARILSVTHTSNTLGTITPIGEIRRITRKKGVLLCVDAAQAVGHAPVDVRKLGCDFLAFSAHKGPMGPTGIGVLYASKKVHEELTPMTVGGGMIEGLSGEEWKEAPPPSRYEAGTPNIAGAVGLGAAIDYMGKIGIRRIESYEKRLKDHTMRRLSEIEGVTVYGPCEDQAAIISFNMNGLSCHELALILDDKRIAVRSGHHCAMPSLRAIGVDGTVRISYHCYNTREEIDKMMALLERIAASLP